MLSEVKNGLFRGLSFRPRLPDQRRGLGTMIFAVILYAELGRLSGPVEIKGISGDAQAIEMGGQGRGKDSFKRVSASWPRTPTVPS